MAQNDKTIPDISKPADHTWKYERKLGAGAEGTVHLWSRLDTKQKVVERLVIKNLTDVNDSHIIQEGPAKGQLLQVYIQQKLVPSGTASSQVYTVPALAARKLQSCEDAWRTYHPYYSMGNFDQLVNINTRTRGAKFFPEPFIWYTLHRMIRAAVLMDSRLQTSPDNGPYLIHNDIKPENIFLGHPGSLGRDESYIMYPPAYLGDFGMSYLTSGDESWRHKIRGTVGWCAPELDRGDNPYKQNDTARYDVAPTSKTNVWQIGYCILRAMEGGIITPVLDGEIVAPVLGNHDLKYRNENWTRQTLPGAKAVYSADLIELVESCVCYELEDRPSPQEALALIEQYMPGYADGMDRWGTLSWVKAENAKTAEAKDGDDAEEPDDGNEEEENNPIATTGTKRKSTASLPPPKHPRFTGALQRRLKLVATQMDSGARLGRTNNADYRFILPDKHKVNCPRDKSFNACEFFECADPGHIQFRDDVEDDAIEDDAGNAIGDDVEADTEDDIEVHYFTPNDALTLQTIQLRYQAALTHSHTNPPDPKIISPMTWSLEQKRFDYHAKRAVNVHEKMYWLGRSVQAEYYAGGRYQAGIDSGFYVGMALLNWRTHLD
jgi:serine/threonine protein kinase